MKRHKEFDNRIFTTSSQQEIYYSGNQTHTEWGAGVESGRIWFKKFVIPRKWYSLKEWNLLNQAYKKIKVKEQSE